MFFAIHSCSQNSSLTTKAAIGFAVDCIPFALSLLAYFGVLKLASAKLEVSIGLGGLSVTLLIGDSVALYYANIALKKINTGSLAKPATHPTSALLPEDQVETLSPANPYPNKHPAVTMPENPGDLPTVIGYNQKSSPTFLKTERIPGSDMLAVLKVDGNPMYVRGGKTDKDYQVLLNKDLQLCISRRDLQVPFVIIKPEANIYFWPFYKISGSPNQPCVDFNDLGEPLDDSRAMGD